MMRNFVTLRVYSFKSLCFLFSRQVIDKRIDPRTQAPSFLVSYAGWHPKNNGWVPLKLINKKSKDNLDYQQELLLRFVRSRRGLCSSDHQANKYADKSNKNICQKKIIFLFQ